MVCKNRLPAFPHNTQPVLIILCLCFLTKNVVCGIPASDGLHCIDPGDIQHAIRKPELINWPRNKVPVGTQLRFYCLNGYKLRGSGKMVCSSNGQWQPLQVPTCEMITCSFPYVPNGHVSLNRRGNFQPGTYASVICDENYQLKEKFLNQIVCQSDGKWTGSPARNLPECVAEKTCPPPPTLLHGTYNSKGENLPLMEYRNGASVEYRCKAKYRLQDPDSFHWFCNQGEWIGNKPRCVISGCDQFSKVLNANYQIINGQESSNLRSPIYSVGTYLMYKCKPGYNLIGQKLFQCKENGAWEPSFFPVCVMNPALREGGDIVETGCEAPNALENGNYYDPRSSGTGLFPVGSKVIYRCFPAFYLEGSQQYSCKSSGQWSPSKPPICIPVGDTTVGGIGTRTISLITAGSILLVLLMVLVLVVVQRKQLSCHICHTNQQEMPITDDPDRVALIAFADGVQVVLPTYEEAIRQNGMPSFTGHNCVRVGRPPRGFHERRVLPNLPGSRSRIGSTHSNPSTESASLTRHASTSTSLGTHSGSVGSLETGTVSEVSTTVTLDTISSNTSNNSETVSCRAQCGSLASYDACIPSNEGAPLLEENEIQETGSNPDDEELTG